MSTGDVLSGSPRIFSPGPDMSVLLKLDRPAIDAVWRDLKALTGCSFLLAKFLSLLPSKDTLRS